MLRVGGAGGRELLRNGRRLRGLLEDLLQLGWRREFAKGLKLFFYRGVEKLHLGGWHWAAVGHRGSERFGRSDLNREFSGS